MGGTFVACFCSRGACGGEVIDTRAGASLAKRATMRGGTRMRDGTDMPDDMKRTGTAKQLAKLGTEDQGDDRRP